MPNVPNVPGVPPLSSYSIFLTGVLVSDALALITLLLGPQWGIFLNGVPVVFADNVVGFDYRQDWAVADYPLEQGAFESYDKVATPFLARVRFSKGGNAAERQAFLASIKAIAGTTQLFDVVTPEVVYPSVNIAHYDYRRNAQNGVGLIVVEVWCVQVRVTAQAAFSNTQAPASATAQSGGTVQAQPASKAVDIGVKSLAQ